MPEENEWRTASNWFNEGVVFDKMGRFDDALACFDRALQIDPNDAFAWGKKGISLARLGRHD